MRQILKRIGALVLSGAMILGLAGCGEKSGGTQTHQTLAQELGYGYVSEYAAIDGLKLDYISGTSVAQGRLYLRGDYFDPETSESGTVLYARELSSGATQEIPLPELVNTDNSHEYIQQLTVCPDGSGYWMVTNQYTFTSGDEDVDYETTREQYTARKCDMSGNVLLEIDLTEAVSQQEYFYCQSLATDADGNLYLATDNAILCFGPAGDRKPDLTSGDIYVESMVSAGDGTVLVSGWSGNGSATIQRLDNGSLTPLPVEGLNPYGGCSLYPGDGNTVLLSDGTLLYALDASTGQTTRLLSWLDSDINGYNIAGVASGDADTVLVLLSSYSRTGGSMRYELGTLTKTPVDQLPERTILTLGAEYLDDVIRDAVIRFNRTNGTYRVTLVDYSVYNTEEDYTAGAKQLDRDVISGNCPDILSLSSGNAEKYIGKGALADLTKLMEQSGVSRDDLLEGPLRAYEKDGKLYGMPTSFGISTLYASARLVGDRDRWTMPEMRDIMEGLDPDTQIIQWYTQTDFLTMMVYQNMQQYVDYGKAACSFDSEEFKQLLEVAAKLPADYETEDASGTAAAEYVDEMQMLQSGDLLMAPGYGASGSYEIKNMYRLYTREHGIVRIGYPLQAGNGAILSVYSGLAISARSKQQEGAWAFMETMLSDEVQEEQWSLPVTNRAFDKVLAQAMEQEFYTDENGEKVYVASGGYIGDTEYQIGELTQEQADSFRDYVNGASISGSYDSDLMDILSEEAAAYFAGDKSADEVAKLIQNRVSIYLGETN